MPSGKAHTIASVVLSAALWYGAYKTGYPVEQTVGLAGGALAGTILTPDLDIDGKTISDQHIHKLGGGVISWIWQILWLPYARLMPHRSIFSHFPILGTALRLLYIGLLYFLASEITGWTVAWPAWGIASVIGLTMSDALHYVMDQTIP